jgi:hypothetical protein
MMCSTVKLWFAVEIVLSAANLWLVVGIELLQQISIHCWKRVGCNEVAFTTEVVAPAAKQFLLPNCAAYNELVFAAELYGLQRINFRRW